MKYVGICIFLILASCKIVDVPVVNNLPEKIRSRTVKFVAYEDQNKIVPVGIGAAVFVEQTLFLTVAHNCDKTDVLKVELIDQERNIYTPVRFFIHPDPNVDLCAVFVESGMGVPNLKIDERIYNEGMGVKAYMAGFPGGKHYAIFVGEIYFQTQINIYNREQELSTELLQFVGVPGAPGISGGGVFDARGRLIGIMNSISNST